MSGTINSEGGNPVQSEGGGALYSQSYIAATPTPTPAPTQTTSPQPSSGGSDTTTPTQTTTPSSSQPATQPSTQTSSSTSVISHNSGAYAQPALPIATIVSQTDFLTQQADHVFRLSTVLPDRWFPDADESPILQGILSGVAAVWVTMSSLLGYVAKQRRIATATDVNLDIIANDFLGTSLPRKTSETDDAYRIRIKAEIFRERGTRAAVSAAVQDVVGVTPTIFEPSNATDTGGWGSASRRVGTGLGYGVAGGYGSYQLPFQAFITTSTPPLTSSPNVQGYGSRKAQTPAPTAIGGYSAGSIEYTLGALELMSAEDAAIYEAIDAVKPVATIMWVSTQGTVRYQQSVGNMLDLNFVLGVSRLG